MLILNKTIFKIMVVLLVANICYCAFAEDELPLQTAKIISAYKINLWKSKKAKDKLIKITRLDAVKKLEKEMTFLTQMADLDRAIAARDLLNAIKKSSDVPAITPDDKKYRPDSINIIADYKKRIDQINGTYDTTKQKTMEELTTDISQEMAKMHEEGYIADSLIIKDLLEKIKAPNFELLSYKFIVRKAPPKKEEKEVVKVKKPEKKPKFNPDELIAKTALSIGNNILSEDIKSEKGLIYVCFAEALNPQDETVMSVRERIERNVFLPILPCSMQEQGFIDLLQKRVKTLITTEKQHAQLPKYCVMLSHLKPAMRKDKAVNDFLTEKKIQNSINVVLLYNKNMFGGSKEAEDLRMQIDNTDSTVIAQLLNKARLLQNQFPQNKDIKKLIDDLSQIKVIAPVEKTATIIKPVAEKKEMVDCDLCKGKGLSDKECPDCKDTKEAMCPHCIGSGILVNSSECPDCKGKGKSWLGIQCRTCEGKGKIKKKEPCPDCGETGKTKCPKCKGTKTVNQACDKCKGTGKVEN